MSTIFAGARRLFGSSFQWLRRARARRELMKIDPRMLRDVGICPMRLGDGIHAWPWRIEPEPMVYSVRPAPASVTPIEQTQNSLQEAA